MSEKSILVRYLGAVIGKCGDIGYIMAEDAYSRMADRFGFIPLEDIRHMTDEDAEELGWEAQDE